MTALFLICLFAGFYGSLEILKRYFQWPQIYTRKIAHITSALGALGASFYTTQAEFVFCALFFAGVFLWAQGKNFFTAIHARYYTTYGEIYFPLALTVLGIFFFNAGLPFVSAILVLGIADVIGALPDLLRKSKTWRGNMAFFVCTLAILLSTVHFFGIPLADFTVLKIMLVTTILTFIEDISSKGSDNLTVPLVCALLLAKIF